MKNLSSSFFDRKTLLVAPDLLGKILCRRINGRVIRQKITEVEAYIGPQDLACHASKGRTKRTEILYGEPGTLYVYLIYGMYSMLNIVTETKDHPSAILIRGTEEISGPGRVARDLSIDRSLNGKPLGTKSGLWIEDGENIRRANILKTPRIGIDYAGIWKDKPYRFVLKAKSLG
jgi:DNA-3-methyladenine glycosylase